MLSPLRGDEIFIEDVCSILGLNKKLTLRLVRDGVLHARKTRDGSTPRLTFVASEVEALKAWYIKRITSGSSWRLFWEARTRKDAHKYRGLRRSSRRRQE